MVAQKPDGERRRRNKKATEAEIPAKPAKPAEQPKPAAVPPLPESYAVSDGANMLDVGWLGATREWYANWAASPQSAQFLPTDWDHLRYVVAPLFDRWLRGGSKEIAAELRLQLAAFGGSPGARNSLGWKVRPPEKSEPVAPDAKAGGRYGHLRSVPGGKAG